MPSRDPKYVRLADHLSDATQADIAGGSGWSISGGAVLPFPQDDEDAARYVRQRLAAGVLEPAGKAEYDEQQEGDADVEPVVSAESLHQENRIQTQVAAAVKKKAAAKKSREAAEEGGDGGNNGGQE